MKRGYATVNDEPCKDAPGKRVIKIAAVQEKRVTEMLAQAKRDLPGEPGNGGA